jgi:acetylornithine deacetylase/succinyl-diaminopimelate desuccinylase-like protein
VFVNSWLFGLVLLLVAVPRTTLGQSTSRTPNEQSARDLLAELININTTHDHGSTTPAAQAMARRLLAAGFPDSDVQIVGPTDSRNQNLVARYRGTGKRRPILLLAHLDVVEALPSDWSVDPFTLLERDGYFYGRGTSDIKDMAALFVAALIRLKQDTFVPDRDIILALTAGEESGGDYNGVQWLLANKRALIDAAYCINGDAGDPLERHRIPFARNVEASEKVYHDFQLVVTNPGGHSSLPTPDNAIYRLAAALQRLGSFAFPVMLNDITRTYLDRAAVTMAPVTAGDMRLAARGDSAAQARLSASSPFFNAQLRTTCVATRLEGGHANNALPQTARAIVNCRMLPGHDPDSVLATLRRVVADSGVRVTPLDTARPSPPSPLVAEVLDPVTRISAQIWPGVPVIPNMETGATDGLYLRNAGMPVYGVSGVFLDADDIRAHGRDERIGVQEYYTGAEFTYRLVMALARGGR